MNPLHHVLPLASLVALVVPRAAALDYQKDILPIVREHCWDCHSNEKEAKGGLALDDLAELAKGPIGPIGLVRPGDPEKSDLLARLKLDEEDDDFMPKNGKALRSSELAKIEQWIRGGALLDAENPSEAELARMEDVKLANARSGGEVYFQWTNPEGKAIEAKFAGIEGEAVKIVTKNGRSFTVPFGNLDEASVALARKLGGR